MVEARGVDLPCGAGRVAPLGCPRHSIHYRSRSTPRVGLTKSKKLPPYGESFSLLVEARGVEPLSENASKGTSPGADACFGSPRFPSSPVKRQTGQSGSFIVHGALKALRTHVRLSSTPRIRAEALPEGTGHGLSRGQNSVIVVL